MNDVIEQNESPTRRPLRVLVIEDSEMDARLLVRKLARGGYEVEHERVETPAGMRTALETKTWDVILSDFSLPHFSAPQALSLLREIGLDLPLIIVSGTIGEETAVESMRAGARDFVVKDKLARLVPAIARELREAGLRRERLAERLHAEAEREALLAELRAAVQARDTFLSIASHELRTPLTSLQLTVQALKRAHQRGSLATEPSESVGASVELMARQTSRLGLLVESLLDVARITSNRLKLSRETVDLADVATSIIAQLSVVARQSKSEVTLDAKSAVGAWDRFRIETVVSNLISNAVKFGAGKPIDVSVSSSGRWARFVVTDRGEGISPADQARIFGKFERAVPERHYGGLGLGLWIARQIVLTHGGAIEVKSEAGKGSTFVVELPLLAPADEGRE
jgi:signal transduction histidine kinase